MCRTTNSPTCSLIGIAFWALVLAGYSYASANEQILYSFGGFSYVDGQNPQTGLVQGRDGALYGTTAGGGTNFSGTLFKMGLDGSGYRLLHEFGTFAGDGLQPYSPLIQGQDGALYGTTFKGGINGGGVIFRISSDGGSYSVIHEFASAPTIPLSTSAILIQGTDGVLYGLSEVSVFKVNTDGSGFMELYRLYGGNTMVPGALLEGADGFLYVANLSSGSFFNGSVFKLSRDGTSYTVLHVFGATTNDARDPNLLLQGPDGTLYGSTTGGGQYGFGTIFQIQPDGAGYATLFNLQSPVSFQAVNNISGMAYLPDGWLYGVYPSTGIEPGQVFRFSPATGVFESLYSLGPPRPQGSLVLATNGLLYGTTYDGGHNGLNKGMVYQLNPSGTNFAVLHSFGTLYGNGYAPHCTLIQTPDESFYGTIAQGGTNYRGMVFRLGGDGTGYKLLHEFAGETNDGAYPNEGVVIGNDSRLYGLTMRGGATNAGVVYSLSLEGGDFRILHHFASTPDDGTLPSAKLLLATDGLFYGTTAGGRKNDGTIFRIDSSGTNYQVIHTFGTELPAAVGPQNSTLVQDNSGTLFGTTVAGGSYGSGTMFSLKPDGTQFQLLHSFGSGVDGIQPRGLVMGRDGNLYGITVAGPTTLGVVFRSAVDGSGFTILKRFDPAILGSSAALSQAPDGTLFGTSLGSTSGPGFAFRLNTDGSGFGVLHLVGNTPTDELRSYAALLPGADGALYDTSSTGGIYGGGTVFRLSAIPLSSPPLVLSMAPIPFSWPPGFQVGAEAVTEATFLLETSTDLVNWSQLGIVSQESGLVQFSDTNLGTNSQRFYRMLQIPY